MCVYPYRAIMNTFRRGNCREGMTCTDLGGDHDHVNICMGICPNPGDMCTHKVIGDYMISSYFFFGGGGALVGEGNGINWVFLFFFFILNIQYFYLLNYGS